MMIWLYGLLVLAVASLALAWPLLQSGSNWKAIGLALLLALPLGGILIYREVGAPAAITATAAGTEATDFDALVDTLKARLSVTAEDLEGWLLLGRSLKSLQRYGEALEALETASAIAPHDPVVKVELAEARLFASGDPRISEEVRAMLESAVTQDPSLQKGLWLLGIDAVQRGDDPLAIAYWQRLLDQLDASSDVAASVREQMRLAQARLGVAPGPEREEAGAWPGIPVAIELGAPAAGALPSPLPESAVLFVIVRPAGEIAGPPLGVARVARPDFPLTVAIDDRNAMLPQRKLSEQPALRFQARLSLSGQPGAQPGDWESEPAEVALEGADGLSLLLQNAVH